MVTVWDATGVKREVEPVDAKEIVAMGGSEVPPKGAKDKEVVPEESVGVKAPTSARKGKK